jgi:hypothetical protein
MKRTTLLLLLSLGFAADASAATEIKTGYIKALFADPSDVVIHLNDASGRDINSSCGAYYYHIQRKNPNFSEFYSLMLAAATAGKEVWLAISGCSGGRAILSHGAAFFPR